VDPVIMASESLTTYLQDHLAGSAAAVEMLETLRDKHAGAPLGEFAADILTEVRQDQATLEDLIEQVGGGSSALKETTAWLGAKLARFRTGVGPSADLGTLEALELVALGILGKKALCPGLMRTGSPRHARFKGRHRAEHAWFSLGDSLPLVSMDADRAGREIVKAICRGRAQRVLSTPANLAVLAGALFPESVAGLLAQVNRVLPESGAGTGPEGQSGEESASALSPSLLTTLGDRAARRNNQVG
jgi:hypothetical protein